MRLHRMFRVGPWRCCSRTAQHAACSEAHASGFRHAALRSIQMRYPSTTGGTSGRSRAFFRLTRIEAVPYDEHLADRLGERTMMRMGEPGTGSAEHVASTVQAAGRSSVLHLSDLHFGADYGFLTQGEHAEVGDNRRTLTECVVADLERIGLKNDIAALIVTGDFITRGDWNDHVRSAALSEFNSLREAFGLTKKQILALPGNHDIVRYKEGVTIDIRELAVAGQTTQQHEREFRTFVDELIDRYWRKSLNYVRQISLLLSISRSAY